MVAKIPQHHKEEIARLRAQAKHFGHLAALKRKERTAARLRQDWMGALKALCRVNEYSLEASQSKAAAARIVAIYSTAP